MAKTQQPSPVDSQDSLPPGNSALEVAARKGFGPLSRLAPDDWHGDSRPCVSCGQLVRREADRCESCDEDLSVEMIQRMRDFAGPWYVLDHVRPFPGVRMERLIRQIRRGVLTESTIVRGPTTDHQWRYAGEAPGLCKYLGVCWNCHAAVSLEQTNCPTCAISLGDLHDDTFAAQSAERSRYAAPRSPVDAPELHALSNAARSVPRPATLESDAARVGKIRASWIAAAIVFVLVAVLFAVVLVRDSDIRATSSTPATLKP